MFIKNIKDIHYIINIVVCNSMTHVFIAPNPKTKIKSLMDFGVISKIWMTRTQKKVG